MTPLRGVELHVAANSVTTVSGPSGSGKTTLLRVLSGELKPDSGEVLVAGESPGRARALTRVGFVHQDFRLVPFLTAVENVAFAMELHGVASAQADARALGLLRSVGLSERVNHLPAELSGGEQQRVALARALANRPAVLIADEPTASLDPDTAHDAIELMIDLARTQSSALLIATHDPAVAGMADQRLQLRDGLLVGIVES